MKMNTQDFVQTQPAPYDVVALTATFTSMFGAHTVVDEIQGRAWEMGLTVERESTRGFFVRYHRLVVTGEYYAVAEWSAVADLATR
jgi:hypothetical protein